ncbi:MAG: MlaD family protein [bacterium]
MKRHLFWIVELFIWLLVLFLVSGGMMFFKYNYKKNFETYQIFLPDVDGLISGSPVKIMGIQIGYINQLDIVGEDVYVNFVITEPNVKIPAGSVATVEFSGLGGSKALELYPPVANKNYSGRLITSQSPKRIHDSLGLLNEMFDKIIDITYGVSNFMDQVGLIKSSEMPESVHNQKSIDGFFNSSNNWLDKLQKQCDGFNDKLQNNKKGLINGKSDGKNE